MEKQEVARLYDRYAQDVFRLALSYLYNRQDAEDVCHSVFLTLVEKDITLFPGREKAWLLKCAANACRDLDVDVLAFSDVQADVSACCRSWRSLTRKRQNGCIPTIWGASCGRWRSIAPRGAPLPSKTP